MSKLKTDPAVQLMNSKERDRFYEKLDESQRIYYDSIFSKSVVCVDAPAGTGKTSIAVLAGLELLSQGKVSKLVYLRFPDDTSAKLGYLPGDIDAKQELYMEPFYESCTDCGLQNEIIDELVEAGVIELKTDIGMRGRNLKCCYLICDETQNAKFRDLKKVLTRLHDDSKCVLIGHSRQVDNRSNDHAFVRYIEHLCKKDWAVSCELPRNYRGKISRWADELQ